MAKRSVKRVSILTGGGDCPGLNAVIRAVVRKSINDYGCEMVGIMEGWLGLIKGRTMKLDIDAVSGILPRGGTILRTSRTNPFKDPRDAKKVVANYKKLKLNALVAIGGEDTLGVAAKFAKMGLNIVGVPKTIDNDLPGTDVTFGFDTAINIAMESIDRLHSTAESHNRVIVCEVMGRHAGWIAVEAGIAGGADLICIPEEEITVAEICKILKKRHSRGKDFSIVVVAEGAQIRDDTGKLLQETQAEKARDAFGHVRLGGIGSLLADQIEADTGFETRSTVLGHTQRGGSPTAFDRVLSTRFGVAAAELVQKRQFNKMVALQGNKVVAVPLSTVAKGLKTVDRKLYEIAKVFFG